MSPHRLRARWTWVAAALTAATLACLSSCSGSPDGTLDPGGLDGGCITQMPRSADGRPNGYAPLITNKSDSASVYLVSVSLIEAHGVELLDAYTLAQTEEIADGTWIPPLAKDVGDAVPSPGQPDFPSNWTKRVPLADSVVAPGEIRELILVIQATSKDDCLYAEGFTLRYRQYGRLFSVDSDQAPMIYDYDSSSEINQCGAVSDRILANQVRRRSG